MTWKFSPAISITQCLEKVKTDSINFVEALFCDPKRCCRERKPVCRITFKVSGIVPRKVGQLKFWEGVTFVYHEIDFEHLKASDIQAVGCVGH